MGTSYYFGTFVGPSRGCSNFLPGEAQRFPLGAPGLLPAYEGSIACGATHRKAGEVILSGNGLQMLSDFKLMLRKFNLANAAAIKSAGTFKHSVRIPVKIHRGNLVVRLKASKHLSKTLWLWSFRSIWCDLKLIETHSSVLLSSFLNRLNPVVQVHNTLV